MIETERKYKVTGDFQSKAVRTQYITQGYLCTDPERTVRVRIAGDRACLTIKGPADEKGWSRYEFEQPVAVADATELLKLCAGSVIEKVRHYVPHGTHVWEVDVFCGDNEGLQIAEIELASEQEAFDKPSWAGEEVTGDARYYNAMLARVPYNRWNSK
jgi:CYTH domain-containing protein